MYSFVTDRYIPKMTEESDLGLSQSPGDERSHLARITYTGDDAIVHPRGFGSVPNPILQSFSV